MPSLATVPAETRIELAPLSFRAEVRPDSINAEARTAELIFSTGAPVMRYDWMTGTRYVETLSLKRPHVRLDRLNNGAPFLNAHSTWALSDVIGVVQPGSAKITDGQGVATVRFSRRADVEPIWQDVRDGIVQNVSVGYRVHKYEQTDGEDGKLPTRHAIDWEPFEISAVPMGADDGAKVRRDGDDKIPTHPCVIVTRTAEETPVMPDTTPAPSAVPPAQPRAIGDPAHAEVRSVTDPGAPRLSPEELQRREVVVTDQDRGADAETKRVLAIMQAVAHGRLSPDFGRDLIARKIPIEQAQALVLEEIDRRTAGQQGPMPGGSAHVMVDTLDHVRAGIGNALLNRVDAVKWPLTENGRAYAHRPLMYHAETCLHARGVRTTGMDPLTLAGAALGVLGTELTLRVGLHTVSDFPLILADVANKILRRAYDEAPQTFVPLATRVDTSDFKTMNMVQLGDAPVLEEIGDNGEVRHGTIGEGREQFALRSYAKIVGLSRKSIVNDDLMAFARLVQMMGRASRNLESNLAWAQITSNPTMGDAVALFHATHGNLTASGTAISVDSLGVGRTALRKQKGIGATEYLNLVPRYIAVPPEKETLGQQFTIVVQGQQQLTPSGPSSLNPFAGLLVVLAEPRLSDDSTTAWYLFADPSQIDILAWAVLAGQQGPRTETKIGFEIEGMQIKGAHDVAMKILDHRGAYKNAGA